MQLKAFVKETIKNLVDAVQESGNELEREISITRPQDNKCIEFDIAITYEASSKKGIGIEVIKFIGGKVETEAKDLHSNRIKFGVYIDSETKDQREKMREEIRKLNY